MKKDVVIENEEVKRFGKQFIPRERINSLQQEFQKPVSHLGYSKNFELFSTPSCSDTRASELKRPNQAEREEEKSTNESDNTQKQARRQQIVPNHRRPISREARNIVKKAKSGIDIQYIKTTKTTRIPPPPVNKTSIEPPTAASLLSKKNILKRGKSFRGGYGYFYKMNVSYSFDNLFSQLPKI
jgi:hypothetical protein